MGGAGRGGDKWHHAVNGQRKGRGTRRPPRSPVPPTARIRRLSEAWPCRLSAAPASCAQRLVSRWPCVLSSEPPPGGCHTSPTDVCGANPSGLAARRVARERPRSASHSSCHPRALSPPSTSGARPLSSGVLARRAAGGTCAAGDVCPALGGQACAFPCGVLQEWPRAGAACTRSARSTGRARALGARERAPLSLRSVSSAGGQDGRWPSCLRGRALDGDARSVCLPGTYFGLRSGSLLHLPRGRPGLWGEMAGPGLLCGSAISVAIWGSALQPEGGRDTSDLRGDQGRQLRSEAVSGRRAGLPSGTPRAASCVTFTTVSGSRVIGLSVLLRCAWETRYHESAFFRSGNFNI